MVNGVKHCTGCAQDLLLDRFYEYKYNGKVKLTTRCKECHRVYREANKKSRSKNDREYRLKKDYGITVKDYELMMAKQGGVCYICKSTNKGRSLCVDHCHNSGEVRKLLCISCNTGLGNFKDNPELLKLSIDYLEEHNE